MSFSELIIQSQDFSAEYDDKLSNHLPMALFALHKVGASESQLIQFYKSYIINLEPQSKDSILIDSKNWKTFLGHHKYNSAYHYFFANELNVLGRKGCLANYLPLLIAGLSGGAFHPLIRLAYAVEIDSDWEVAEALSSWCMAYQELGSVTLGSSDLGIDLISAIKNLKKINVTHPTSILGENVYKRLKNASEAKSFSHFFQENRISKITISNLSELVLVMYLSTNDDFTALHFVTSVHALRVLSKYLENP